MLYTLALEAIGDDLVQMASLYRGIGAEVEREYGVPNPFRGSPPQPWAARITGLHKRYGLAREFLEPQKDYSRANGVGSRGVYAYYFLPDGIYEIYERQSWRSSRRYFLEISDGTATEMTRDHVEAIFANHRS